MRAVKVAGGYTLATVLGLLSVLCARPSAAAPLVVEAIVSAPLATVWQAFVTHEGYASVGSARADIDLKIGGTITVQAEARGNAGTTVSEILSFEPERLLSTHVRQPAAGFADARAFTNTWTIVYFTPLGPEMTHVRIAGFGFNDGADAAALTRFFEQDQAAQLRRIEKKYWPLCELCKQEAAAKEAR